MAFRFDDPRPYAYRKGALFLGLDQDGGEVGYETEIHALTCGSTGTGKGAGLLVPNARRWPHNLFVIDPKGENAILSWQAREALGQRVAVIDPFNQTAGNVPRRLLVGINPLADIDPASPRARAAIVSIGSGLVVSHNADHMEWTEGARSILAGLCAYVVADAPPEMRTFAKMREILMQPDHLLLEDAQNMAEDKRIGGLIRIAGNIIVTALTATKGIEKDFLGGAKRATNWLDDEAISASLSESDFHLSDLKTGPASLFIVLPADYIADYSGFLRLLVKSALHEMGKPISGRRCLFLLDEFFSLGKLEEVAEAAGRMRSMGVTLWPFIQGLGQLEALYGKEGAQTFLTNAAVHCFLGNDKDGHTLAHISRAIGNLTPDEIRDAPPPIEFVAPESVPKRHAMEKDFGGYIHKKGWFNPTEPHEIQEMVSRIETEDENRRRKADARNEERRREVENQNARARAEYDHDMKRVGQPRITPDEIAALIGKDEDQGEVVARSMIVLGPSGIRLNLNLAPYFWYDAARDESWRAAEYDGPQIATLERSFERMLFDGNGEEIDPANRLDGILEYAEEIAGEPYLDNGVLAAWRWKSEVANCWAFVYNDAKEDGSGICAVGAVTQEFGTNYISAHCSRDMWHTVIENKTFYIRDLRCKFSLLEGRVNFDLRFSEL